MYRKAAAFTLLEVILALSLTALVLVAIGMAVDSQLRLLDRGRSHAEEAQLARVILHQIANDLRNAVRHNPLKLDANGVPSTETGTGTTTGPSTPGGTPGSPTSPSPTGTGSEPTNPPSGTGTGTQPSSTEETEPTADPTDVANSTTPPAIPGVYGNMNAVQVDVSRLPRVDQLASQMILSPDGMIADNLSDLRTVTYFVASPQTDPSTLGGADTQSYMGLVRREMNRATASYASDGTDGLQTQNSSVGLQQIAPEVANLEFEYFDGTQWTDSWDTNSYGGLPMAIRIYLYLFPQKGRAAGASSWAAMANVQGPDQSELLCYQLTVYLPGSAPASCDTCGDSSSTEETNTNTPTNQGAPQQ